MDLALTPQHDEQIRAHAERIYPHECCGFLLGRDEDNQRRIVIAQPEVNARGEEQRHNRFTIAPEAFMLAEKAARAEKLDILGFYHSHPDVPARPSTYDLEHAWPFYSYVIVSVIQGRADTMTSWRLQDDRSTFNPQTLRVAQPQET